MKRHAAALNLGVSGLIGGAFGSGHFTGTSNPMAEAAAQAKGTMQGASPAVYYGNFSEAREAGVTSIDEGEPGYAPHLDRDGDGVACE